MLTGSNPTKIGWNLVTLGESNDLEIYLSESLPDGGGKKRCRDRTNICAGSD